MYLEENKINPITNDRTPEELSQNINPNQNRDVLSRYVSHLGGYPGKKPLLLPNGRREDAIDQNPNSISDISNDYRRVLLLPTLLDVPNNKKVAYDDSRYPSNQTYPLMPIENPQNGGAVESLQQGGGIEDQVTALVLAAMSGDQEATKQIEKIMQAAQNGNKQAMQIAQMIQQVAQSLSNGDQTQSMKNGGKTKKKIVKKGGSGMQAGRSMCPCLLKKAGGRLIEIDSCTGLPVHKNGGNILKLNIG